MPKSTYRKQLCAAVTLAAVLAFAMPGYTQELPSGSPPPATTDTSSAPHAEAPAVAPAATGAPAEMAPAKTIASAPVKQKAAKAKHVKHKKKKATQKSSSRDHGKLTKKSSATIHQPKNKKKASAKTRTKEVHKAKPSSVKTAAHKVAPKETHRAEKAEKAVVAPTRLVAKSGSREVAYTFCLGYDNCVPHRYEASVNSGKIGSTKILRETPEGNWAEGKIDPVMANDLDKLASRETDSHVSRNLSAVEKTRIADHQGRVHASLVSDVKAGALRKEQVKSRLRDLSITTVEDLDAYDPRLRHNEVALEAAHELAAEKH